jgi:hypothetical protein
VSPETWFALGATGLAATLLVLTTFNAGPLWRDETNTFNMAQSPSLKAMWDNLPFDSFPPLYILLLRAWGFLGMAGTDAGIRVLGLFIGLLFVGSLWIFGKFVTRGAPTLSLGLLFSVPAVIFVVTSNRAYGLAMCLLVFTFVTVWRLLEHPSKPRILVAALVCFLFAHCLYYSVVFLGAILFGGVVVAFRRKEWRALFALSAIGCASAATIAIYLPIVRRGSTFVPMFQVPMFGWEFLWSRLNGAIAMVSSAQLPVPSAFEVWIWIAVFVLALAVGCRGQFKRSSFPAGLPSSSPSQMDPGHRADLALLAVIALVCGTAGHLAFLMSLHYPTQSWYYVGLFTLWAISVEAVLGSVWAGWRPWGATRVVFLGVIAALCWRGVWEEAHTRRSNMDLVGAALSKEAAPGDLILVFTSWEGITFERYFHGPTPWETVPPLASHKTHRLDLMWDTLSRTNTMEPVLAQVAKTLREGAAVWVVGHVGVGGPARAVAPPPPPSAWGTKSWLAPYFAGWGDQLAASLASTAAKTQTLELTEPGPVNLLEKVPVFRFSGFQPTPAK